MSTLAYPDGNLFDSRLFPSGGGGKESFETLLEHPGVRVERIVSHGQVTPEGEWYDQPEDEWVMLVTGEAALEYGDGTTCRLKAGDYLYIPAGRLHRVTYTSSPAVWLALFFNPQTP